jgi:uncharacterized BrkB/YihY/UPF0761 family membrane protein
MSPSELVVPPPVVKTVDFPVGVTISFAVLLTVVLIFVAGRFDPTFGILTISLLVVVVFLSVVVFCLFFTIPNDEITSGVVGGLIAAFGAVVAHWIGRVQEPK